MVGFEFLIVGFNRQPDNSADRSLMRIASITHFAQECTPGKCTQLQRDWDTLQGGHYIS